ncbi:hypothetical protein [Corynebacterium riegelii]|uniref:hypothetical protein n=1 Tax=Corynebacterium riegelii TaxID=156976 RepID=UPI00288BBFF6|nr:hypothetical protein [Corynebacterium riegelii]
MRTAKRTAKKTAGMLAAAATVATMMFAPAAHADEDVDWTGGRPLPPGTAVPFEPGYASAWRNYDVIRPGDPNFRNPSVQGIRVIGHYDKDTIMCLMNAKGGISGCYVDGKPATDLGWGTGGIQVTVDPTVAQFAPVIRGYNDMSRQLSSGSGSSLPF